MKIVNNGLPPIIYEWLCQDFYDTEAAKGSISATSLKKPIQEYLLTLRHIEEIEVDATDRIWSLFGSGCHAVLEKLQGNYQQEERLFAKVKGRKISGKFDLIVDNQLHDFKVTSAWTLVFGDRKEEWRHQLSTYRWLKWKTDGTILNSMGKIIAILRDWNKKKVGQKNYPVLPIVEVPIELYPLSTIQLMIEDKVMAIKQAEKLPDDKLPECTPEERWWNEKDQEYKKCSKYCAARAFCWQLKRTNKEAA
jgi:hypothetical protein